MLVDCTIGTYSWRTPPPAGIKRARNSPGVIPAKSRTSRLVRAGSLEQGGLWQAGYYDHCLRGDEDLRLQARYILENPVRAGIVESPRDYPYSWSLWGLDV